MAWRPSEADRAQAEARVARVEAAVASALQRVLDRAEKQAVDRLRSVQVRKGTYLWNPPGDKPLDADVVLPAVRWDEDARPELEALIRGLLEEYGAAAGVDVAAPEAKADPRDFGPGLRVTLPRPDLPPRAEPGPGPLPQLGKPGGPVDLVARWTGDVLDGLRGIRQRIVDTIDQAGAERRDLDRLQAELGAEFERAKADVADTSARAAVAAVNEATLWAATATGKATHKFWLTARDERVRHTHRRADGQVRLLGDPFTVGGFPMMFPGDRAAPIGEWINCRCALLFVDRPGRAGAKGLLEATLGALEGVQTKVRHVRTPEGARRYRLPVGAPILHVDLPDGSSHTVYWHGSPNGELGAKVAHYGVHVGTYEAAKEALEVRIGRRADGRDWDGTAEYGRTLVAGSGTGGISMEPGGMEGHYPKPATYVHPVRKGGGWANEPPVSWEERDPEKNYNATGAIYSDGSPVPMDAKPALFPVRITGEMSNTPDTPHEDFKANGLMAGQLKRGRAKRGYYYTEAGEDEGSIAAVLPSAAHVERLPMPPDHVMAQLRGERPSLWDELRGRVLEGQRYGSLAEVPPGPLSGYLGPDGSVVAVRGEMQHQLLWQDDEGQLREAGITRVAGWRDPAGGTGLAVDVRNPPGLPGVTLSPAQKRSVVDAADVWGEIVVGQYDKDERASTRGDVARILANLPGAEPPEAAPSLPEAVERVVDTANPADDDYFGNAAAIRDGHGVAFHVTDDPARVTAALDAGKPLDQGRDEGLVGDLGTSGLYVSAVPDVWMARSSGKWGFLESLTPAQLEDLTTKLAGSVARDAQSGYIAQYEADRAYDTITAVEQGKQPPTALVDVLANQPYNIAFWKPEWLSEIGIEPGRQPVKVEVDFHGRFARVTRPLKAAEVDELKRRGFAGALMSGSMSAMPQLVIWDNAAVDSFGGHAVKALRHVATPEGARFYGLPIGAPIGPHEGQQRLRLHVPSLQPGQAERARAARTAGVPLVPEADALDSYDEEQGPLERAVENWTATFRNAREMRQMADAIAAGEGGAATIDPHRTREARDMLHGLSAEMGDRELLESTVTVMRELRDSTAGQPTLFRSSHLTDDQRRELLEGTRRGDLVSMPLAAFAGYEPNPRLARRSTDQFGDDLRITLDKGARGVVGSAMMEPTYTSREDVPAEVNDPYSEEYDAYRSEFPGAEGRRVGAGDPISEATDPEGYYDWYDYDRGPHEVITGGLFQVAGVSEGPEEGTNGRPVVKVRLRQVAVYDPDTGELVGTPSRRRKGATAAAIEREGDRVAGLAVGDVQHLSNLWTVEVAPGHEWIVRQPGGAWAGVYTNPRRAVAAALSQGTSSDLPEDRKDDAATAYRPGEWPGNWIFDTPMGRPRVKRPDTPIASPEAGADGRDAPKGDGARLEAQEALLARLERKDRRVRTPEGARRYKLPVGAAIRWTFDVDFAKDKDHMDRVHGTSRVTVEAPDRTAGRLAAEQMVANRGNEPVAVREVAAVPAHVERFGSLEADLSALSPENAAHVRRSLEKVPPDVADVLHSYGVRVRSAPEAKYSPRSIDYGGLYLPDERQVLISDKAVDWDRRKADDPVPSNATTAPTVLHELGHAFDAATGQPSKDPAFRAVHKATRPRPGTYWSKSMSGTDPREETFAEAAAHVWAGTPGNADFTLTPELRELVTELPGSERARRATPPDVLPAGGGSAVTYEPGFGDESYAPAFPDDPDMGLPPGYRRRRLGPHDYAGYGPTYKRLEEQLELAERLAR